jgi:hypothetical protein
VSESFSRIADINRLALFLGCFGLASVLSQPVQAQALDIDQPEITKGEREVRSVNVANGGFPAGSGGMPRTSHELSTSYSPTGWMKLGAHFDIENVIDEGWRLDHGAIELQFELLTAEASGGIALGWTTNVQISTDDASTNSLIFGPIVKFSSKAASLTLNPYFEDTFGRNDSPGLAALYGWQGRLEVRQGLAIGIEGYGKIDDIADPPPVNEQDHRVGPAVYLWTEVAPQRTASLDAALLFGLTEAAPATSFKFNFGMTF